MSGCPHGNPYAHNCLYCKPCPHKKLVQNCVKCRPCPRGKLKQGCKQCNLCHHDHHWTWCRLCNGCAHDRCRASRRHCKAERAERRARAYEEQMALVADEGDPWAHLADASTQETQPAQ